MFVNSVTCITCGRLKLNNFCLKVTYIYLLAPSVFSFICLLLRFSPAFISTWLLIRVLVICLRSMLCAHCCLWSLTVHSKLPHHPRTSVLSNHIYAMDIKICQIFFWNKCPKWCIIKSILVLLVHIKTPSKFIDFYFGHNVKKAFLFRKM